MPRIPFTDLASSPEFKAMPPEDQQVVATGYWDEVATERPDQAEFYKGIRDVSKSLLDAKTERADASPVQRRFLDARVQDLAFDLSLGDELAQGRLTQEGYTEALKVRDTESAQRQAQLDKTRNLFSDDPVKQKALAIRLDGLEQTAITGGIFGKMPFNEILFNTGVASRDAYAALKEQTAKDYGMEPDEVEDLVKHRLGFQEKPVSRDAVGNPFIKPEIIAQGPDAVKQAILNSDLPWREKQRMTAEGDLKERMDGYYKSTMEGVKKNHSELYKLYKLDLVQDDPKSGFSALTSSLNQDFGDKFASGFTGYTFGVAEQVAPAAAYLDPNVRIQAAAEGRDSEQAAQEARGRSQRVTGFARRAQESVNQLSKEFYKNQGTLWGVDASAYGSGAGSVLTALGLGMATGPLSIAPSAARAATMGPTALRMLNGANSVMRASPSIGLAMAQTGTSTYENALKSGKSEEEAGKLATLAGAGEGVFTGLFSLLGVGGLESVGEQLIGTAARQAVRDTAKSGFRTFGEKMLKGVTAEQFEEGLIAAFDSATVQARINPNMTVEDFQNTLRETALVTLAVSGPTIGMGALKQTLVEKATYQQTDDEVELRADLNLADATTAQPGEADIPPAGQGPANAAPNGGAVAPGAPAPVAPGGTQPVAPAQGATGAPAAVPGVQPVGAAQPVLVRSNAEVDREMNRRGLLPPNPMLTPEERQADLRNRAPDLAAPAPPAPGLSPQAIAAGAVPAPTRSPAAETPAVPAEEGTAQREGQGPQEVVEPERVIAAAVQFDDGVVRSAPIHALVDTEGYPDGFRPEQAGFITNTGRFVSRQEASDLSKAKTLAHSYDYEFGTRAREQQIDRVDEAVSDSAPISVKDIGRGEIPEGYIRQGDFYVFESAAETPAVEEAPAETLREPEPTNWSEVFEVLNDRDPDTKPINTESSKFRELVKSLKDTRVGELVGGLFQKKADVAELEKRIKKERKEREDQRKERNRFRMKNKPLDVHQEKIKELTGHGHGFTRGIKDWLVERGLNPLITINKTWRQVALRERNANSKAKTERIQAQFDKLTPEAKEVVEAFHKMGKKPVEEKESLEIFFASKAGQAIRAYGSLKSKKYFTDRGLPVPNEYDGLDDRVPPHIATAVFKNSDTAGLPDQVAETMGMDAVEFWIEFWAAVKGQTNRVDQTQEDFDERNLREAEDREIAFAEQQIKALENEVQTVDLREVREGDKFTLGGFEYTAIKVEADKRGNTESFTLRGDGPLKGTTVSEDFFAESVTPTKGSLAHVDPAEIEAINIAQAFPEEFEDVAEPAPTATEPPTAGPVPYSPEALKETFDVSDEQAVAMDALVQAMGLDTSRIQLHRGGFQTGPDILYQETSSTKWDREKFDSLPDQSKKNLAINIVEYGWNPAEFGMTDADVQTWAAEGLAKRAARLAEETAAEARSRAVLEKSKTAPPEASLVTEADLQESQLPDDGYFYHVTTPTGARAILKSRRIASGKRQSMADGYYSEYSRGKVFFTDRGGVSYWQGKISDHLEAQGRSGKTVTIRIPKHAVGDLKVDEPGTRDARTPAWFSPENVLFQNQQGTAKGSFEQLPETGDILLRGLSSPDVSTGVHEIAHAARRTILNRDTPAEARAGITDADIAVAEEWAGAKDGVWTRAAEEKFARGWERYLRDGKSPVAALQSVFDKMAAWLRSVYVTVVGSPIDVEISPEMRAVFDKLVSRTLPQATTPPPPAEPTPAPVAELEDPDVVGMQNAATDRRRQRAGLPPRFAPVRLTNQAAWDEAMRRINRDPAAGRDLVNDLRKSPRSLDPVETALYTHELLVRTQRTDDAYAAYNKDQNDQTEKDMREAVAAEAEAILTAERIGTIEGRALQARKILVHQDFSLGRLVAKATAANGGKELNADQMKEIAELHKKLQDVQTELAAAQEQIAKEEAQRVHVTVVADYKKGLRETKKRGEKGPGFIDRQAEAALARIKARKQEGRLNSLPLDELLDHAIVGVRYLKNGLVSIGEFTTQLVKDFGRKVLPFANDIFAKSQELYSTAAPSSKVKSRQDVLDDIDSDAPLNDKAIFQLVRHYINEGVDGFEPVMQAVLTDLRQFYPDLTLREVHDAYSKYGQTSVPSKEPDLKLAREYRELSRLQSQLEDAERSLVPLKTGLQREKATQRVRDLTKQVKDTMRRLNIQPTTNENQLRSAFDAIKTRLRNEYEDLDTAIRKGEERKERSPQTFTPEQEKELKDLRQRRDDRKADYEAIFKKKGLTDAERIDRAERLLDRRIAEERDMLEKGILKRNREMLMGPFSPALKSRRETLDKLKAERRELQKAARPKTPELEKKYQRDLKSLEKRIKEEEDLLAAGLTARQKDIKMGKWTPEMAEMQARLDGLRDARRELAESRKPEEDEAAAAYERATKAIEASIQRYKDIIAGIAKPDAGKKYSVDAEMAALLDQRDALRDAAAALRAMDPARIDKRKQAVLKALDKSIIEISRKITDGDLSTKGRTDFFAGDPDVTKLRAARDLLNKTLETMRKDALPKRTPEEIRNSRDRKLIENKIDKLRDRLARGDYAPKPKLPPPDYAGRDALIKEKKRLESEFNMKVLELALASRSLGRKILDNTLDVVFGVSRAMLTSFDAGAFGRQAGLVNFMRPGLAIKNFPANFAFTEKAATRYETAMEADPRWSRAQAADLALTSWRPGSSLTDMEEVYRSRIAKKIPGVAASERAYVTYLNQVRFTYFNALMDTLPVAHQTEENMKFLSRHVNIMTGRGKLGPKMEGAAAALASLFFSPKYWWSRLQVLGNMIYIPLDAMTGFRLGAKETKIARQIVAVEYARLGAMLGLVFGLFAFAKDAFDWAEEEFSIGTDWRSSDFGKLRIGNTRIDFMAGLLQNVVFIGRMVTGEKTTAKGEVAPMSGPDAKFKETRLGETVRLLRTKLSPAAGLIANALDGADVVGNKFNWETEILGSYIPMSAAETYSSMRELGVAPGAAAGLLNFIGIGASTYGGKEDYVIEQDIMTGRVMEPFGIKPGTFFIDQSRYKKEVKEKGWVIPKSKGLPTF